MKTVSTFPHETLNVNAHLSDTDVGALRVDVRVVRQEDVQRRLRLLRNHAAAVAGLDDVRDVAVLADYAKAQRLRENPGQRLRHKIAGTKVTSPTARLSHAASILSAFTVSSWKLPTPM